MARNPPLARNQLSPTVTFRHATFSGLRTGALDILLNNRRIISVPSQLGCQVGCQFCVSRHAPLVRNLEMPEMLFMVQQCLEAHAPDGRPIELSFTGEGEPLVNWRNTQRVAQALARLSGDFDAVRYCFSGLGASQLLARAAPDHYPTRLQFSLHAARQSTRDRLIPRSETLEDILTALHCHQARFSSLELNVVLQDGINDSPEDLVALQLWGDRAWPILLNPMLGEGLETVAARTADFEAALLDVGRSVKRSSAIASAISRQGLYPLLSARNNRQAVSFQRHPPAWTSAAA